MKTLALGSVFLAVTASLALAGSEPTYSGKEMRTTPAPSCDWYQESEWNVGLWGAYAFTGTDNDRASLGDLFLLNEVGKYDRFLGGDHAWGGGADIKYFFHKYFGIGVEGFGLAAHGSRYNYDNFGLNGFDKESDRHTVGAALGTLTLRYPIACSRFAPYVWAGGGGIFGGHNERPIDNGFGQIERVDHENETKAMGQFGGGFEVRITPKVGWINDFSWNVVDGEHNNFGMARSGINISF
jgi:hypothetical protein